MAPGIAAGGGGRCQRKSVEWGLAAREAGLMDGTEVRARVANQMAKRPTWVALLCLAAGAVALLIASSEDKLWPVLVGAVAGIVLIASSLLWVNDELGRVFGDRPPEWLKFVFVGLSVVGAVLIWAAASWNNELLGVLATVIAAVAVIGWHVARRSEDEGPGAAWSALWRPFELMIGGVLMVWALDGFTAFAWVGLLVALFGLIELKQSMATLVAERRVPIRQTIRLSIDATVVGLLAVLAGASSSSQLALLLGLAATFGGLSVLGLTLVQTRCRPRGGWVLAGVGLAVLGVAWAVSVWVFGSVGPATVLTVFVSVVGAWFVWRGEGIILVVFIGFIAVWGMTDPATGAALDPNPEADVRILALGDSFISGEGALEYFPGTNQLGRNRNECRRAATAHPYLVADQLEASLTFVACSGAKAADLSTCGQMASGDERCKEVWTDDDGAPGGDVAGVLPQLQNFTAAELAEFDVVLLSVGGNDVGFSTIVQACLLPRSCNERSSTWLGNIEALGPTLIETYGAVREAVGLETPVVVVPYPMVLDTEPCNLGLDEAEHLFVQDFIRALDEQIFRSASVAGVYAYRAGVDAFAGNRLCDDEPALNHLVLDPAGGSAAARYLPSAWIHGSMHPNERGHELLAFGPMSPAVEGDGLAGFVERALEGTLPGSEAPATDAEVEEADLAAAGSAVDAVVADDLLTDGQWISDELYRTIRALLIPIVLALAGSFVLALGLANTDRQPFRLLRPRRTWRDRATEQGAEHGADHVGQL